MLSAVRIRYAYARDLRIFLSVWSASCAVVSTLLVFNQGSPNQSSLTGDSCGRLVHGRRVDADRTGKAAFGDALHR